jgi:sec-independent protein translocase protein TatA
MLGFDNPIHLIFVLVLLLLVFGAKRLPEMGRSLGSGMRGFRDSLSGDGLPTSPSAGSHEPPTAALEHPTEPSIAGVVAEASANSTGARESPAWLPAAP